MSELNYKYFGLKVVVYKTLDESLYPWRFKIFHNDRVILYFGVPNYCESKASALKRAWYRCKWLTNGEYDNRYVN